MPALTLHSADNALTYELIEAAVQETGRGRWFLAEYARRNRNADTVLLLEELKKISAQLAQRPQLQSASHPSIQDAVLDIGRAIARTERDIRAISVDKRHANSFLSASDALDDVVETTQKATSSILSAAERIQEYAWTMREQNSTVSDDDVLDTCASEIYVACGFQDLTAQRISKVVNTLRFVDERVSDILKKTGLDETLRQELINESNLAAPSNQMRQDFHADDIWMSEAHQAEIDETFEFFTPAETRHEPTMVGAELFDAPETITDGGQFSYEAHDLPRDTLQTGAQQIDENNSDEGSVPIEFGNNHAENFHQEIDENHAELLKRAEEMRDQIEQKHQIDPPSEADAALANKNNEAALSASSKETFNVYEGLSTEERLRSFR